MFDQERVDQCHKVLSEFIKAQGLPNYTFYSINADTIVRHAFDGGLIIKPPDDEVTYAENERLADYLRGYEESFVNEHTKISREDIYRCACVGAKKNGYSKEYATEEFKKYSGLTGVEVSNKNWKLVNETGEQCYCYKGLNPCECGRKPKVVIGWGDRSFIFCSVCGRNSNPRYYWSSPDEARREWNRELATPTPSRCSCGGKPVINLPPTHLASPFHSISCSKCDKKTPVGTGNRIDSRNLEYSPARYAAVLKVWNTLAGYVETDPDTPVDCFCGGDVGRVNASVTTISKEGERSHKPYSYCFCRACNFVGPKQELDFEASLAWNRTIVSKMKEENLTRPETPPESVMDRHRVRYDAKPIGIICLDNDGKVQFIPSAETPQEKIESSINEMKSYLKELVETIGKMKELRPAEKTALGEDVENYVRQAVKDSSLPSEWWCPLCRETVDDPLDHLLTNPVHKRYLNL